MSVPSPQRITSDPDSDPEFRFAPCRDAEVVIRGSNLVVNRVSYGRLAPHESVTVDHGAVLINGRQVVAVE